MEMQNGAQVFMCFQELCHGCGFHIGERITAGTPLSVFRSPADREVSVQVISEQRRSACDLFIRIIFQDRSLGINIIEVPFQIIGKTFDHHARFIRIDLECAVGILDTHLTDDAVSVEIFRLKSRHRLFERIIPRNTSQHGSRRQIQFGTIRTDPRDAVYGIFLQQ